MKRSSSARPTSSDKGLPPEPPSPASPPIGVAEFQPLVSSSLTRSPEGPSSPGPAIPRPQLRGTPQQQSYNDSDSMSSNSMERGFLPRRDSRMSQTFEDLTPETRGLSAAGLHTGQNYSRYSAMPSRNSVAGFSSSVDESDVPYSSPTSLPYRASLYDTPGPRDSMASMAFTQAEMQKAATTDALLWDEKNQEGDDYLHNPDPGEFERAGNVLRSGKSTQDRFRVFSYRGITNVIGIFIIMGGLIGLFALWPIITEVAQRDSRNNKTFGWNIGGTNSSGQVPEIENWPMLIDKDTPKEHHTFTNSHGDEWKLVFSDEFNEDGRSFYPGDDPYWEATDLNYWATHNYEWTHPDAVTTKDGKLEITLSEQPIHGLSFRSGFLQSWNKLCFSKEAYMVVNLSLPVSSEYIGYWPGIWTMGNLGRAGFGATNDGLWPYSYDSCDAGTLPNQTYADGSGPDAALHDGDSDYGGTLSYLPGQRLSACTCDGKDDEHPGPRNSKGRAAPEIDILEAQVDYHGYGTASQSLQIAPFDPHWLWNNVTGEGYESHPGGTEFQLNDWKGSINQESASGVSRIGTAPYGGDDYMTFGYEYKSGRDDGYITWYMDDKPTWTLHAAAFPPNDDSDVGQRLISEEPMYMMLNLFISSKFQDIPDFEHLTFPAILYIDSVRVYQPKHNVNLGCDPKDHPTHDYIQDHLPAYTNPNYTTWEEAGYSWPRNSMGEGGCDTKRAGP